MSLKLINFYENNLYVVEFDNINKRSPWIGEKLWMMKRVKENILSE